MSTQVGAVGNFNYGTNNYTVPKSNTNPLQSNNSNVFDITNNPMQAFSTNTYDDDMMMPEYLKTNNATTTAHPEQAAIANPNQAQIQPAIPQQPQQTPVVATQPQFTGNTPVIQNTNQTLTENGNPYNKTNFWKSTLIGAGVTAPLIPRTMNWIKGGTFKELFKLKPLALICTALGLAGWAIGSMIDNGTNTKRAKVADETALALQNHQTAPLDYAA